MKRVLAVLMLFSIMLTAVPSLAAKQKSIPVAADWVWSSGGGLLLVSRKNSDRNYLYDEDGKLVLESPGKGVKFEAIERNDYKTNSYIYQNVVVDGKCITVSLYDGKTGTNKYGLVSKKGKILCDCKYDEMGFFSEGIAVVKQGDKYGYINTSGKLISKCQWNSAWDFQDGLARVSKGKEYPYKYGFINTSGELIGGGLWDETFRFDNGSIVVKKNGKYRVLNKKGKVISKSYSYVMRPPIDGYLAVKSSDGWGVINSKGKEVIECQYSLVTICGEGVVSASDLKNFLLTVNGKVLLEDAYSFDTFSEGLLIAEYRAKDKKYHIGAINKKGKVVLDFGLASWHSESFDAYGFKNGLCFLRRIPKATNTATTFSQSNVTKTTWGFMNKKGEWVIELKSRKYEPVFELENQLDQPVWLSDNIIKLRTLGSDNPKYGMMNTKGKVLLKCEWDYINPFVDGLAYVRKDDKRGYVNTKGEMVISCDYEGTQRNGLVVVNKGGKDACFNKKGKTILPAKYKSIVIGDKVIAALKDDQILFFDLKGKPIMEEETPVVTPAPEKEEAPAVETTPAEETAPAQEEAPVENTEPPADTGEAA